MPLTLKQNQVSFQRTILHNVEVLESYVARDKASPQLSVISQNKITQILKNNILFFLFFTLASEVFSYVLSGFFGTET